MAQHGARGRANNDLVRLGQRLQAGGQVRRLPDDRGFRCRPFADLVPHDYWPRGDPDADR